MIDSKTKRKIVVENATGGPFIRLYNFGDMNAIDDILTEEYEITNIQRRDEKEEGADVFILAFAAGSDTESLQRIIDTIE